MMQPTEVRNRNDLPKRPRLDWSSVGRILVERKVSAGLVVVREVRGQNAPQVPLAEHDDMVEAFASHGTDEPLSERILPRALWRREYFFDAHALHAAPKVVAVDAVAIAEQKRRRGVIGKGVHELLGGPVRCGMLGDVEVNDTSSMVSEHDEDEKDTEAHRRHGEEVERNDVADMVGEERPPCLRRAGAPPRHEPRDGAFRDLDPELEKFAVDSRSAP